METKPRLYKKQVAPSASARCVSSSTPKLRFVPHREHIRSAHELRADRLHSALSVEMPVPIASKPEARHAYYGIGAQRKGVLPEYVLPPVPPFTARQ
jgi:hypothetical protein